MQFSRRQVQTEVSEQVQNRQYMLSQLDDTFIVMGNYFEALRQGGRRAYVVHFYNLDCEHAIRLLQDEWPEQARCWGAEHA